MISYPSEIRNQGQAPVRQSPAERPFLVPNLPQNALNGAGLKFSVSLEDKTVTVDGSAADVERARAELDDIGFTAE